MSTEYLPLDQVVFMGEVAKWLKSAPSGEVSYGTFYVDKITLSFEGEAVGEFRNDEPDWQFVFTEH